MRSSFKILLCMILSFALGMPSIASSPKNSQKSFEVDPFSSKASAQVKYTFGGYLIQNADVRGQLELNRNRDMLQVRVAFSIQGFRSGNPTLDCHLQESLGLDYSQSDYPAQHVCVQDRLPIKDKNSVRYPEVAFRSTDAGLSLLQVSENPVELRVFGHWNIHGIEKPTPVKLEIRRHVDGYRVRGRSNLSLKDFGVVVKKFLFISVSDEVQAEWDVIFRPDEVAGSRNH